MNCLVRRVLGASRSRNSAFLLESYSTRTRKPKSVSSKPSEIPFQPKLANAVNLIGQILTPVQFATSPDGNSWAGTVITRQESPTCPFLSIPVIFEGDLAHTAASHLKLNDFIHVSGQLCTDPPHFHQNPPLTLTNMQVMVQSLNFVEGYPQVKDTSHKIFPFSTSQEHDINPSRKYIRAKQSEEHDIDSSWKDLLDNPMEWWDVRSTKENPKGAAFERKTNGELLFINSSTPKWIQEKLESMTIDLKPEPKHSITAAKKDPDPSTSSWTDLLDNPNQWCDYRDSKLNGSVNPKHPDFKRKDRSVSLWLNRVPAWVLPKLEGLEFDVHGVKSKRAQGSKGDQSWNDLVQNSAKWWDNRLNKRNEKAPDFKHKETGEVLWLKDSPSWVLSKLPPLKPEKGVETGRKKTLVS